MLPTYRISGYEMIDGYSSPPSHGDYGIDPVTGFLIGSAVVTGLRVAAGAGATAGGRREEGRQEVIRKQKLQEQQQRHRSEREKILQDAAATQSELQGQINSRDNEIERRKEHLRQQMEITKFTDVKRSDMGIEDADLARMYEKDRSLLLEEFAATGSAAAEELERIRLMEEGPEKKDLPWKLIAGSVAVVGIGSWMMKRKKKK